MNKYFCVHVMINGFKNIQTLQKTHCKSKDDDDLGLQHVPVNGEFQWHYFQINYFGTTLLYFCNMLIMWWLQLGGHGVQAVINSHLINFLFNSKQLQFIHLIMIDLNMDLVVMIYICSFQCPMIHPFGYIFMQLPACNFSSVIKILNLEFFF